MPFRPLSLLLGFIQLVRVSVSSSPYPALRQCLFSQLFSEMRTIKLIYLVRISSILSAGSTVEDSGFEGILIKLTHNKKLFLTNVDANLKWSTQLIEKLNGGN